MSVLQDDICLLAPSNILEPADTMYNRNREKYEGIQGNSHKLKGIWEFKNRIMVKQSFYCFQPEFIDIINCARTKNAVTD